MKFPNNGNNCNRNGQLASCLGVSATRNLYIFLPKKLYGCTRESRMQLLDWSRGHIVTTTSPRFLRHATGFQWTRRLCSKLWCWCRSVLIELPPTNTPNSVFLLPLLHVINIAGEPRLAYGQFPEPEP